MGRLKGELGICNHCKKEKKYIHAGGRSKGLCKECYRKLIWKPKLRECKRCKRMLPHQAKGLCKGCYNILFHLDKVRAHNLKKRYNLDDETYRKITKECVICGFDKVVDLHHLDHNSQNNSHDNLIGICPNHHRMIHFKTYQKEVFEILKQKGFKIPKGYEMDGFVSKVKKLKKKTEAPSPKPKKFGR